MERVIEFALAQGWPDDAIDELQRLLRNKNMDAALTLVRAQDMSMPPCQQLMAMVILEILS